MSRTNCRPLCSRSLRRRDVALGHRMARRGRSKLDPHSKLAAQLQLERDSSRCGHIRHMGHDENKRRNRRRLERPSYPEFECWQTARLAQQPKSRQQPQSQQITKTYSFFLSLNYHRSPQRNTIDKHHFWQSAMARRGFCRHCIEPTNSIDGSERSAQTMDFDYGVLATVANFMF